MAIKDYLQFNVPIVDKLGLPTPQFIRFFQNATNSIAGNVPSTRKISTGRGLAGGGDLSADRTLTLNAGLADLNDVDPALAPADKQVLTYVAADNKWEAKDPTGGGGGGGSSLLWDPLMAEQNNASPTADGFASAGSIIIPTADFKIGGLTGNGLWVGGITYVGRVYEVDPTTGAIIAQVGADSVSRTIGVNVDGQMDVFFATPIPVVTGTTYVILYCRSDSPTASINYRFNTGANYFRSAPIGTTGVAEYAQNTVMAPGTAANTFTIATTIFQLGVWWTS